MVLVNYFKLALQNYTKFSGRANRPEFWYFYLANVIISIVLRILGMIPAIGVIFGIIAVIYGLAVIVPSLAVGVRRFHDSNLSGTIYIILFVIMVVGAILMAVSGALLAASLASGSTGGSAGSGVLSVIGILIMLVAAIIAIVFLARKGTDGANKYGEPSNPTFTN